MDMNTYLILVQDVPVDVNQELSSSLHSLVHYAEHCLVLEWIYFENIKMYDKISVSL